MEKCIVFRQTRDLSTSGLHISATYGASSEIEMVNAFPHNNKSLVACNVT